MVFYGYCSEGKRIICMHSCKSGCMHVLLWAHLHHCKVRLVLFWPWHFSCSPIFKRIIAAERWGSQTLKHLIFLSRQHLIYSLKCPCECVTEWKSVLKMSTRTGSKKEGLFKIQNWQAKWHEAPPSWYPRGYQDLWCSKVVYKLQRQEPWGLFLSLCECSSNAVLLGIFPQYIILPDALWFGFHLTAVCYCLYP